MYVRVDVGRSYMFVCVCVFSDSPELPAGIATPVNVHTGATAELKAVHPATAVAKQNSAEPQVQASCGLR